MAEQSVITSSREKSHLLLSEMMKAHFNGLSTFDKNSVNAWIIERMTDIQRDLAVSFTLNEDEKYLNTCRNKSTARMIGYNFGFTEENTKAAKGVVTFFINLPYGFRSKNILIKADEVKLYADGITYMFPGDIEIIANENGNIQAVRRSNHVFETSDNVILYSTSEYDSSRDEIVFGFGSEVIQVDFVESSFLVPEHLEMTNAIVELFYDNSFYKLELWYEEFDVSLNGNKKTFLTQTNDLSKHNAFSDVFLTELGNDNKLNVTLGNGLNGRYYPAGKEIKYRIYSTNGKAGNTINPSLNVSITPELMDYSIQSRFIINPTGGEDEYDLLSLKNAIIKKIQTPDSIITDNDLKNKLSDILSLSSEETFHKLRRNDPIERILELFIIVKDRSRSNVEVVVPTNTLDIEIDTENIIDNNFSTIRPFFMVESSLLNSEGDSKTRKNKVVPSYRSKVDDNIYYSSYYAIKLKTNPVLCNFFNLSANYQLTYKNTYVNKEEVEEVYINAAIVERDIFNSNNLYYMRLTLDSINKTFLENNTLLVKARFFNTSAEKQYEDFIVDFSPIKNDDGSLNPFVYEARITSNDVISDSNNLFIKDVYKLDKKFQDGTESWALDTRDFVTEVVDLLSCEICIFQNSDTKNVISNASFQNIQDLRYKNLLSTYKIDDISLYRNVDDIIYCQCDTDPLNRHNIIIRNVPLFKEEFINNLSNKDILNSQMNIEKSIKNKLNDMTEFPSHLSLKYFNTYGFSNVYSSLDNVSLKLEFEVSYKNNKVISNTEMIEIKDNLIKFINSINKKDIKEDKNIYLSDLIAIVKNNPNIIQCQVMNFKDNIYYDKFIVDRFDFTPTSLQLDANNIIFNVKSI